jgi:hypothetical protein
LNRRIVSRETLFKSKIHSGTAEVDLSTVQERQIETESAPPKAWMMGLAGWLVPGLGHLLQGKWIRALLLGGAVWACFIGGFLMGGHLYKFTGTEQFTHEAQQAALPTFEYGWTFLLVAGLLNYLAMLDAFDIAAGRKS